MSEGPHEEELAPGHRVGDRYAIEAPISTGAMGAVYRARDEDGRLVAVKRLIDLRQAARFEIEARLLSRLSHPRVVRVLEHLLDEGGSYLVMDLVEGTDLNRVLRERGDPGLPVAEAVGYAREVCEGLQYVHDEQVVHRDVKPHNIILAETGVVLVDFGIAREVEGGEPGTRAIGTPLYMAPEVMVGEGVSPRSDVYGVGATLWALLTGSPPAYHDETPLARTVAGVSEGLEATLRAALELHPERRIASVSALAEALGSPLAATAGASLALSAPGQGPRTALLEAIVRTAAGVFEAAAASVALSDETTGALRYESAWGAGADEIVGVSIPRGKGIAGAVAEAGVGEAVPECRRDSRFAAAVAAGTGYVPHTMLVVPLRAQERVIGALSVLDRRDGEPFGPDDLARAELFADLTVTALRA